METTPEKQHARDLIERLEFMLLDPVAHVAATAPPDDEPLTEQGRLRFHNGQAWLRQHGGKGIPMEDVLAGFDLKPEDLLEWCTSLR